MSAINNTWRTEPLGSAVIEMKGGASLSANDFTDSGFPVLHKGSIQPGGHLEFARDGKIHTSEDFVKANPSAVVDDRFVVATLRNLVRTGETLGFVAPVPEGRKFLLAQGAYGLRLDPGRLDPRYLSHLSNAWVFHSEVLRRMVGTTQVHIRNGDFLAVPISFPPLSEQQRIVEILDRAGALRTKRREAIAKLDQLLQSVFLDMFGDPNDESGTDLTPFLTVFVDASAGHVKTKQEDYLEVGSLPIVDQGQALIGGYSNDLDVKSCAELPVIVFGDHTRCVKYVDFDFGVGADGVKVLRPRSEDDPHFLYWWLRLRRIPSAGYSRHFKFLKEAMVRRPSVDEQRRFGYIARSVNARLNAMEAARDSTDQLFLSLQSRAFSGAL